MSILIVSSYLPYPLFSGGHIRLYNLIKQLSKKHSITLICESRQHQTAEDVQEVEKLCKKVIIVPRKKQWSIKNIWKAFISSNSFLVIGHTNTEMKEQIIETLKNERFDLIHVETFYVIQNIPDTKVPIVLAEHNIEYLVYKRFVDRAPIMLRPLLLIDIAKLKKNERDAWKRATRLISVSEEEKNIMERKDVIVVPNGVDLTAFTFKKPDQKSYRSIARRMSIPEKELLFIGDFKWFQNRDAVRWIINDIWPYLLRSLEGEVKIKLRIVGKNIPESIRSLSTYDSIIFDQNAPKETVEIFKKADILLAPIRIGGGTSYKILEAMATGIPVVTTARGIKGIDAKTSVHAFAADDTQSIVDKCSKLLRDDELYASIASNARKLIEEKYNWEIIGKKLDEVYQSI